MKTIPEPIQNWNNTRILNPSNLTGLKFEKKYEKHHNQPNLQQLAGAFILSENLLIVASQQSKVYCNQLPSPEAIAERLRLLTSSATAFTDDDQPEVV